MINAPKLLAVAVLAAALLPKPAAAVPFTFGSNIVNGPTLDVGNLRFTLTGCTNSTTCSSDSEFVAFGNGIKIQGANGAPFTSISGGVADTTVTFVVRELGGRLLNGMVMTDTGNGTLTNATTNIYDSTGGVLLKSVSANAGQTSSSGTLAPQTSFTLKTDIATGVLPGTTGGSSTVSVAQTFTEVPEPAALALLAAGLASLGLVRRRA